jgi:hypothetical protein
MELREMMYFLIQQEDSSKNQMITQVQLASGSKKMILIEAALKIIRNNRLWNMPKTKCKMQLQCLGRRTRSVKP